MPRGVGVQLPPGAPSQRKAVTALLLRPFVLGDAEEHWVRRNAKVITDLPEGCYPVGISARRILAGSDL